MHASEGSERQVKHTTSMELKGDREIVIARTFGGPARIVFEAWTQPELVKRWWAPKSHCVEVVTCEADVRVGGAYRYVLRQGDQEPFAFSGKYMEITPHTRLVYTQIFEPMAHAGELIVTVTFDERAGRTHLISHELYPSKEAREAALAAGMEHGMRETMDQLDELVSGRR